MDFKYSNHFDTNFIYWIFDLFDHAPNAGHK